MFTVYSCGPGEVRKYVYDRIMMSTVFQIIIYSPLNERKTESIADEAFRMIAGLEDKFSISTSNSVVFRMNRDRHAGPLDAETYAVFTNIRRISEATSGSFDITVFPLVKLWGFYNEEYRIADKNKIKETLRRVGYSNVMISTNAVTLSNGAQIDLGGAVKGYAVDKVVEFLKKKSISAGIVNAGGNLRVFGVKPDASNWKVGIRHPRKTGEIIKSIELTNQDSISTSGDYERYFIMNGTRYHHILNPKTGFPVNNGVVSVSVIDPSAWNADIISTVLFVMGMEKGIPFAESNRIAALFIMEKKGKLSLTNTIDWKPVEVILPNPTNAISNR